MSIPVRGEIRRPQTTVSDVPASSQPVTVSDENESERSSSSLFCQFDEAARDEMERLLDESGNIKTAIKQGLKTQIKITKRIFKILNSKILDLQEENIKLLEQNRKLTEKGNTYQRPTYACVTSSSVPEIKEAEEDVQIIVPKENIQPKDAFKLVKNCINSSQKHIKINTMKLTTGGKVVVTAPKDESLKNLKDVLKSKCEGKFDVRPPKEVPLKICIHDVDEYITDEDVHKTLIGSNPGLEGRESELSFLFSMKIHNGGRNVVMTVSKQLRRELKHKHNMKLYVGSYRCNVEDYVAITQCFNCCGFGHTSKYCKSSTQCYKCGGSHSGKNCDAESNTHKCVNCTKHRGSPGNAQMPVAHSAISKECSTRKRQLENEKKKVGEAVERILRCL